MSKWCKFCTALGAIYPKKKNYKSLRCDHVYNSRHFRILKRMVPARVPNPSPEFVTVSPIKHEKVQPVELSASDQ